MKKIVWVVILSLGTIACNDSRAVELPGKELPTDSIKSGRVAGSVEVKGNMIIKSINEAGFYNYEKMDLRTNNPEILKKIPELNEFFPKIGLYRDKFRKKLLPERKPADLRIG